MSTLLVHFEGFFQCRLATDDAPYDDPRGTGGWTFALGNEPALDRVIRFQDPVALRTHAPPVDVRVTGVASNGHGRPDHPLVGARVRLLGDPVFEGRNGAIAGDTKEPISPMRVLIESDEIRIGRQSDYDVESFVARRAYMGGGLIELPDPGVRGVRLRDEDDARAFRSERLRVLRGDLAAGPSAEEAEILQARIAELESPAGGAIIMTLFCAVPYKHTLADGATLEYGPMTERINGDVAWPISYWMGCWDADTLTGFVRGKIELPLA